MAWPTIIFHIVKVINGADLRSGLRSRTYAEGGSVAIERLGTLEKPKIWGKDTKCNCAEDRILVITGNSRNKGEDDSSDVNGYLELNGSQFQVLERVMVILPEGTF
jgi:hypothetical protein